MHCKNIILILLYFKEENDYICYKVNAMRKHGKIVGRSYVKRVIEINEIVDHYAKLGYPMRTILREYIYPKYPICEATLYNIINASADPRIIEQMENVQLSLF